MKIALYIEDGLEQIVLTPETETEKGILGKLHDSDRNMFLHRGSFYACRGGWVRQKKKYPAYPGVSLSSDDDDESTIIVLRPTEPEPPQ